MKYIDEYRDAQKCRQLAALINRDACGRTYKIMEVCGTHTAAIHRFGIRGLISGRIELISGPGCPVCVTSDGYLSNAITLARRQDVVLATYPDMLRVPVQGASLEKERAKGRKIFGINSAFEALDLARQYPDSEVVFLAVGFETTAPGTALVIRAAEKSRRHNFSVYSSHKTIPEALRGLGKDEELALDGFLLPGHVSAVIGLDGYRAVMRKLRIPAVICGFEPSDILLSIYTIIRAVNQKKAILENAYRRIVNDNGNPKARALLAAVFQKGDGVWRGLGEIDASALDIRRAYHDFDATRKFSLKKEKADKRFSAACRCGSVLKGVIKPTECPFFAKKCSPESPLGPCMVSREGTCRSYYEYHAS